MSKIDALKNEFRSKAIDPDELFLLRGEDAIDFIRIGQLRGLNLLGIDGFRTFDEGGYQPVQSASNDISDYSGDNFVQETIRLILSTKESHMSYEVVFDEANN